jgi:2'-5' RNA ligase
MHGLVTLLPSPYYERVEALWKELETEHNLQGIKVTPFPHFSWQIAADYDFDALAAVLQEVVKTIQLIEFHAQLWQRTQGIAKEPSPLYHPDNWVPHISLAYEDVDQGNVSAVIRKLAFEPINWEMNVENLALIYEPDGAIGQLKYRFEFQKNGPKGPNESQGSPG